jgi:hypothetical protein
MLMKQNKYLFNKVECRFNFAGCARKIEPTFSELLRRYQNKYLLVFLLGIIFSASLAGCGQVARQPAPAAETTPSLAPPPAPVSNLTPTSSPVSLSSSPTPGDPVSEVDLARLSTSATEETPSEQAQANPSTSTPDTRKLPKYWAEWPLVPAVSAHAKEIYRAGLEMGNDPHSFSTIGDCQSVPSVFMGTYDSDHYDLGKGYEYLEETIQQFKGSFNRDSISVKDGLSVASVLSPMWADPKQCQPNETPLDCELRLHKPAIMFINLGTNWKGGDEVTHEKYMRQVVDILIAHGVIPILASKGDNQEGGHRINQSIARVAYDYDVPFWNFWLSIRDLPGKGIDGSREGGYLTPAAWGRRSFSGLRALDAVWREVNR